jgi:hypothetical protein
MVLLGLTHGVRLRRFGRRGNHRQHARRPPRDCKIPFAPGGGLRDSTLTRMQDADSARADTRPRDSTEWEQARAEVPVSASSAADAVKTDPESVELSAQRARLRAAALAVAAQEAAASELCSVQRPWWLFWKRM